jgi:hypothetical protein
MARRIGRGPSIAESLDGRDKPGHDDVQGLNDVAAAS